MRVFVTLLVLLTAGAAAAAEPGDADAKPKAKTRQFSFGAKSFDAGFVRPLEFCGLIVSSAAFVPASIMTLPSGKSSIEDAYDMLVREPSENVFDRRLGDL